MIAPSVNCGVALVRPRNTNPASRHPHPAASSTVIGTHQSRHFIEREPRPHQATRQAARLERGSYRVRREAAARAGNCLQRQRRAPPDIEAEPESIRSAGSCTGSVESRP